MAKKADQSIISWLADVRRAAFRLEEIGAPVTDEDMILVLTNNLPPSYSQLIVTFDSTPPDDLNIEYVITHLLNEESRQANETIASTSDDHALAATTKPLTPIHCITCFNCKKKGHYKRDCPTRESANAAAAAQANKCEAW